MSNFALELRHHIAFAVVFVRRPRQVRFHNSVSWQKAWE